MSEAPIEELETVAADSAVANTEPPGVPRLVPRRPVSSSTNARLTLVFVGCIFSVCFFAWGGAKVACNHHPPSYQAFKSAPLEKLAKNPKDAALEFQHRLFVGDFAKARELVFPEAAALVDEAQSQCDASCEATAKLRSESAATRATLRGRSAGIATVQVESEYGEQRLVATYELKFESPIWKLVRRTE